MGNGSGLVPDPKWWQDPKNVVWLVMLIAACGAGWAMMNAHCDDALIHHSVEDLDKRYMSRETIDAKLEEIMRIAERIEKRVDRRDGQ